MASNGSLRVPDTFGRRYSAQELLALRGTKSQPNLAGAIEEHVSDDVEVVKDHILRGTRSFAARSNRSFHSKSSNTLRVPSRTNDENRSTTTDKTVQPRSISGENVLVEGRRILGKVLNDSQTGRTIAQTNGISPTPSLRKKKAEAILKEHSSPPGVRVTAGGRIVPSDQSPLCHPRYGYSAIKANGGLIKFSPNHPAGGGEPNWSHALTSHNGFIAQDVQGRLCQIVDGTIMPLNEVNGALHLYVAAPNLHINQRNSSLPGHSGMSGDRNPVHGYGLNVKQPHDYDLSIPAQIQALEREYAKLDRDLKELDKAEVLQREVMSKAARDQLVQNRRQLVITLDRIRKALKSIKMVAPAHAPIAPRAMHNSHYMPPQGQAPQPMTYNMLVPQPMRLAHPPLYYPTPAHDFGTPFGFAPFMDPAPTYGNRSFSMPGPVPQYLPALDPMNIPAVVPQYIPAVNGQPAPTTPPSRADDVIPGEVLAAAPSIAQADGARSFSDLRVSPPRQSHALPIKAPELKAKAGVRSGLNPMSPAYKPGAASTRNDSLAPGLTMLSVKDRPPTPLPRLNAQSGPEHHESSIKKIDNGSAPGQNEDQPSSASLRRRSSSVSSFATADFFPRDPREYSLNKHKYPMVNNDPDDKENHDPVGTLPLRGESLQSTPEKERYSSEWTSGMQLRGYKTVSPASTDRNPPVVPPGTPITHSDDARSDVQSSHMDMLDWQRQSHGFESFPDRNTHNLSPKSKRQDWLTVQDTASLIATAPSSPAQNGMVPEDGHLPSGDPQDMLDFTQKSREFLEGFRAGLARKSVSYSRIGDYMDGYCAGLLKSAPMGIGSTTGSPMKQTTRRPSPAVSRASSRLLMDRREPTITCAHLEPNMQSLDTMKQAVFAPQNENAILSPAADGPRVNETGFNLGRWAKAHEESSTSDLLIEQMAMHRGDGNAGFPSPQCTSPIMHRPVSSSKMINIDTKQDPRPTVLESRTAGSDMDKILLPARVTISNSGNIITMPKSVKGHDLYINTSVPSQADGPASTRSMSGQSNLYRHYPGHRVFSPHLEWKSASSVAQVGAFASGSFSQYDGAHDNFFADRYRAATLTDASDVLGAPQTSTVPTVSTPGTSQMPQAGRFMEHSVDGGPTSPILSPVASLSGSPKHQSPGKSSPARAKFEAIAGKVGIKAKKDDESASPEKEKLKWRDIWRLTSRKDSKDNTGKDDSTT